MGFTEISEFEITGEFIAHCVHVSNRRFHGQSFPVLFDYPYVVDALLELSALLTRILEVTGVLRAAISTSRLDSLGWPIQIPGGGGKVVRLDHGHRWICEHAARAVRAISSLRSGIRIPLLLNSP